MPARLGQPAQDKAPISAPGRLGRGTLIQANGMGSLSSSPPGPPASLIIRVSWIRSTRYQLPRSCDSCV